VAVHTFIWNDWSNLSLHLGREVASYFTDPSVIRFLTERGDLSILAPCRDTFGWPGNLEMVSWVPISGVTLNTDPGFDAFVEDSVSRA
jgi:hypothetical protein